MIDVAKEQRESLLDRLRRPLLAGGEVDLSDGQLLEAYIRHADEPALAALVRRHGPMVWGVCRRLLAHHQDAEDAFQATFLVLVRKAASVKPREMVGNWLHGVAHRTARKARAMAAKRCSREKQVGQMPEPVAAAEPGLGRELERVLDQELSRLPDKYRAAIVLCDLEGNSRREVARRLQIPEGTLSSRLTTARNMLARRLSRCGLALSGAALAALLAQTASAAEVPGSVASATLKAAALFASGKTASGVISVQVIALTQGVLKAMLLSKLKIAAALLVLFVVCGTGLHTYSTWASTRGRDRKGGPGAASPDAGGRKDAAKEDGDWIQGTWKAVQVQANGKHTFQETSDRQEWVINRQTITMHYDDGTQARVSYKLGPAKGPKTIELTYTAGPFKGYTFHGIYQLKGNQLKVAYTKAQGQRPRDFQDPALREDTRGSLLFVLERKKDGNKRAFDVPAPRRVDDQDEAIKEAQQVDLPLLENADKVVLAIGPTGKAPGPIRQVTLTKPDEIAELTKALKPEKHSPTGGRTAVTITFFHNDKVLRKVWVFQGGEWGFERPGTSWTTGRAVDLWRALQRHME